MGKEAVSMRIDPEDHLKDSEIRLLSVTTTSHLITEPEYHDPSHRDLLSVAIHRVKEIPCAGIAMGILAGIVSSIASFIVKLLPDVNPVQIVIFR